MSPPVASPAHAATTRVTVRVLLGAAAALLVFGVAELVLLDVSWRVGALRSTWAALAVGVALALPRVTPRTQSLLLALLGVLSPVLFAGLLLLRQDVTGVSFAFFLATPMVFAMLLRGETPAVAAAAVTTLVVGCAMFGTLSGASGDLVAWSIGSLAAGAAAVVSSLLFRRMAALSEQLHAEHLRAVEARAREALAQAQAARSVLLSQVAAGLAHEINNPLAAIVANLAYLEQASGPDATAEERAEIGEVVRVSAASAARVADVIRRLQTLAPASTVDGGTCDAVAVLRAVLRELPPSAAALDDRMPRSAPEVAAPPAELRLILQQLVQGALDVLAAQQSPVLTLEARDTERHVELVLRDNARVERGAASSPDRGELRARGRDSGLGLVLAREVCAKWAAAVDVVRADDGGEQITLRLPRAAASPGR